MRSATDWSSMMTREPASSSLCMMVRPAMAFVPMASKYSGSTPRKVPSSWVTPLDTVPEL